MSQDYEAGGTPETASQLQLAVLHETTRAWLVANTEVQIDADFPALRVHTDGMPVAVDGSPLFREFTVSGAVLREHIPAAAAALSVGDSLTVRLNEAYLVPHAAGVPLYMRRPAECSFDVQRPDGDELHSRLTTVKPPQPLDHPRWQVEHFNDPVMTPQSNEPVSFRGPELERDADLPAAEYDALQAVVIRLGELKQLQEAQPPEADPAAE